MTTSSLTSRIQTAVVAHKATQHLIERLQSLSHHHLQNDDRDSLDETRLELTAIIHQQLREQEDEHELLSQEVEPDSVLSPSSTAPSSTDAQIQRLRQRQRQSGSNKNNSIVSVEERKRERVKFVGAVAKLGEDLKIARTSFRHAQLSAKRSSDTIRRRARERLIASTRNSRSSSPGSSVSSTLQTPNANANVNVNGKPEDILFRRRKGKGSLDRSGISGEEIVADASNDVTTALRRTHTLMLSSLSQSRFANETLAQSTAALSNLTVSYSDVSSLLQKSRNLVGILLKSNKSDTWYLETALYVLIATIAWLVWRRLLLGPTTVLILYPLRLVWWFVGTLISSASFGGASSSVSAPAPPPLPTLPIPHFERNTFSRLVVSSASTPTASRTLKVPRSATGKPSSFPSGYQPYLRVGGGGRGGPGRNYPRAHDSPVMSPSNMEPERNQKTEKQQKLVDSIGEMIDASRSAEKSSELGDVRAGDGSVLRERREDEKPNPKKRMWEEPSVQKDRKRDEL